LNPIERFWQEIRRFLKNKVFACIDDLMNETKRFLDQCTPEFCRSVVGYHFYDKVLAAINNEFGIITHYVFVKNA